MDEPMVIIQRHTEAVLNDHMLYHAISELSAVLGGFTICNEANTIFSWHDEADGDLTAQASRHGLFIFDCTLPKARRNQIAGACYFYGIPLFVEEEILAMMEVELEQAAQKAEAEAEEAEAMGPSIISLDKYRD